MSVLDPERPYTSYQRREVIVKLTERFGCDLIEATKRFNQMEQAKPDELTKLIAVIPKSPPEP